MAAGMEKVGETGSSNKTCIYFPTTGDIVVDLLGCYEVFGALEISEESRDAVKMGTSRPQYGRDLSL